MKIEFSKEFDLRGSSVEDAVWIDIETRKVPAPESWGYKNRWSVFMVGIAVVDADTMSIKIISGSEGEIVEYLENFEGCQFCYTATRQFDEMVLKGRFTNARRALSDRPGPWPNLNDCKIDWHNLRKSSNSPYWVRSADCESSDVPYLWAIGQEKIVVKHCLRDVIELFLQTHEEDEVGNKLKRQLLKYLF